MLDILCELHNGKIHEKNMYMTSERVWEFVCGLLVIYWIRKCRSGLQRSGLHCKYVHFIGRKYVEERCKDVKNIEAIGE